MYALVKNTEKTANVIAVSENKEKLKELLKKEAAEHAKFICWDERDFEDMGYRRSIDEADDYWSDEDDEFPVEFYIEGDVPVI